MLDQKYTCVLFLVVYFLRRAHADSNCIFLDGDGSGGTEKKIGNQKGEECVKACLELRKSDPFINGVTIYKSGKPGCWCELNMTGRDARGKTYKSCFFDGAGLEGDARCKLLPGDGIGGINIKIGEQKGSQCVDACLEKQKSDPLINGVTLQANNRGGCWCEKQMKGRNGKAWWKSCFIGDTGLDGDSRCTFISGDGLGGTELKVGNQKGSQCIDACMERRKSDGTINGVTVKNNKAGGCWCERNMASRNSNSYYKSCFIGVTTIKNDKRCTFYNGDGIGKREVKVGPMSGSECISACLELKEKDDTVNGVTIKSNNDPGCYCEYEMASRTHSDYWRSCFIGKTGVTSSCRIRVLSIDHTQGNDGKYFHFDRSQLGILETDKVKTFKARNSRTGQHDDVIVWSSKDGGSAGDAHGRFNRSSEPGQWKVGDLMIPDNEALCIAPEHITGGSCQRNYIKIGCFDRKWEREWDLLITTLDRSHQNYTRDMDWSDYTSALHKLSCECVERAKGHYEYFAIGFNGECIASKDTKGLEKMFSEEKESSEGCVDGEYSKCDKNDHQECVGLADYDFFYQLSPSVM